MTTEDVRPPWHSALWLALLLLVAVGLQSSASSRMALWGAQPDFILTVALTAALLRDAATGSLVGVVAGLLSGVAVGQALGTFMASRAIAGFVAGGFTSRLYGANPGVVLLGVFVGSVVAETVFGLAAPRLTFFHWVRCALIGGAMNALLALPLSWLLIRVGWGRKRPE